jgi:hypothetical protein
MLQTDSRHSLSTTALVLTAMAVTWGTFQIIRLSGQTENVRPLPQQVSADDGIQQTATELNQWFRRHWEEQAVSVAKTADDLTVFRRIHLALVGTIPSLQDIRRFEADQAADRIDRWTVQLLRDPRFPDYFAERLARSLVGTETGPFIIFRRDRLKSWLSDQIRRDRSWSEMTREMISGTGLWTDQPATNFITVARVTDDDIDENKLAGRTVRTFLGQRIDCAQCHDHPFDPQWKQKDFEGLAAFFCQADVSLAGVTDRLREENGEPVRYRVTDPGKSESDARMILPAVPFLPETLPKSGSLRRQLADWVTAPENSRFHRAIANRVWGLMFGKAYQEPIDDLPNPDQSRLSPLDILGQSCHQQNDRLSVLIRSIAASQVFRLSSESKAADASEYASQVDAWSVFPLIRLRPEQVIGSLFQAAHLRTIDHQSHLFVRLRKFGSENEFLNEYGDAGEEELTQQPGTISQALLRMNGKFTRELVAAEFLSGPQQLVSFSTDPSTLIENSFLCCLCRRPYRQESLFFLSMMSSDLTTMAPSVDETLPETTSGTGEETEMNPAPAVSRAEVTEDIFWTLINSPEFSWNY